MSEKNEKDIARSNNIRLNRFLAMCGMGSRRSSEDLIRSGQVTINGLIVADPSRRVNNNDIVLVEGNYVKPQEMTYVVMNKPEGIVCAVRDEHYRTVIDILPSRYRELNLFPVGRLDKDSRGLIILTNDGKFGNSIAHPSFSISKQYRVRLDHPLTVRDLNKWKQGVRIGEKTVVPLDIRILPEGSHREWITITLGEGLKREIRVMASALGYKVRMLERIRIGRMELKKLKTGEVISLSCEDLGKLIQSGGYI